MDESLFQEIEDLDLDQDDPDFDPLDMDSDEDWIKKHEKMNPAPLDAAKSHQILSLFFFFFLSSWFLLPSTACVKNLVFANLFF